VIHLPVLVVLLNVLLLFATGLVVAGARGRHGVKAPATTGHPDFERAFRVQMNTLEHTVVFLRRCGWPRSGEIPRGLVFSDWRGSRRVCGTCRRICAVPRRAIIPSPYR
jgi:hypothetical protein